MTSLVDANASFTYFKYDQEKLNELKNNLTWSDDLTRDQYLALTDDITNGIAALSITNTIPDGTRLLLNSATYTSDYITAGTANLEHPSSKSWEAVWTFKTTDNGSSYKLYNEAAEKYMGAIPNADETLIDLTEETSAGTFTISRYNNTNNYIICNTGSTENKGYLHMASGTRVVRWVASAEASQYNLVACDETEITNIYNETKTTLNNLESNYQATSGAIGHMQISEDFKTALANYNNAPSADNYVELYKKVLATKNNLYILYPEADKYYTIQNARDTQYSLFEKYDQLTSNSYTLYCGTPTVPAAALWKFVETNVDGNTTGYKLFKLQNANSGKNVSKMYWACALYMEDNCDDDAVFDICDNQWNDTDLPRAVNLYDHVVSGHDGTITVGTNAKDGSATGTISTYKMAGYQNLFNIDEATEIPFTISAAGYATLNLPFAVEKDEAITAYTGEDKGNYIALTELTGNIIPKNTPVILYDGNTEGKTYQLKIAYNDATVKPDNYSLLGTNDPKTLTDTNVYILKKGSNGTVGFYLVNDNGDKTIPANKAYLVSNDTQANGKAFNRDNVTGINTIGINTADTPVSLYDLNGRRVPTVTRGIYVTPNGQKIFIK